MDMNCEFAKRNNNASDVQERCREVGERAAKVCNDELIDSLFGGC